ncbi:MAG TPA: 3-hydroxyacyl-CoA dehydrogenase family protein [Burkholderiales bacterium]|nr:3-hydroxyacyl-CoA dehydrogenase family protein [Burkholderiales bacterium]
MQYAILDTGFSRSFPATHALLAGAAKDLKYARVVIVIGEHAGKHAKSLKKWKDKAAVLIELGTESLGAYTGESRAEEGSNVLGFARFRLGNAEPTQLVELVRQPRTGEAALAAAKEVIEGAGLQVAVCGDFAGRIIDRLVRPYYNAALRRLDEGLATADDLDTTLKLGLGYPEGPIALLERTGLAHHFDVTQALYEATGEQPYAPARRARVAKSRMATVKIA